jgi:hypothetical protein
MKFFSALVLSAVSAGRVRRDEPRTVVANGTAPLPTEINNVVDAWNDMVTFTNASTHGCQCLNLLSDADTRYPGKPRDELDRVCLDWQNAIKCQRFEGGVCGAMEESELPSYTNHEDCDLNEGACEKALCKINKKFAADVNGFDGHITPTKVRLPLTACTRDKDAPNYDSCCFTDIFSSTRYNAEIQTCEADGTVRSKSAADCTAEETWDEASQSCSTTLNEMLNSGTNWEQNDLGFYIHVSDYKMTWDQARTYCQGLGVGGEMAMPADAQENREFFDNLMAKTNDFGWWGFKRFDANDLNTWNGADRRPMNWSNWCSGEPNNAQTIKNGQRVGERCAITWSNTNPCWNDIYCGNRYRAICVYYA